MRWTILRVIECGNLIKPLDGLELPFVDRIEANWAFDPLAIIGGAEVMKDAGEAENL